MGPVGLMPRLAPHDAEDQRKSGIGDENAEQDRPYPKGRTIGFYSRDPEDRQAVSDKSAPDIAHENFCRRPVQDQKTGTAGGQQYCHPCKV